MGISKKICVCLLMPICHLFHAIPISDSILAWQYYNGKFPSILQYLIPSPRNYIDISIRMVTIFL